MPLWWNGRHRGLKIRWVRARTGSNPVSGTMTLKERTDSNVEIECLLTFQ